MRKMKKINGYLVVKFNDRELREWEDTGLGKFGIIDAELYTGCLEVDRSVMEYDCAENIEEAVEQARGLEAEIEVDEPSITYTIVKETDETTEEETVEPQLMIAGWMTALEQQITSCHYPSVNPVTARHQLYGFKTALHQLGLLNFEDCFIEPKTFELTTEKALGKVNDTAATVDYLKRQLDMATHNLFCYSANLLMSKPKEGYEVEWLEAGQDCVLVKELLRVISSDEGGGGYDDGS